MYKCKIPVLLVVFAVFSGFVQAQEIQRSKGYFSGSLETNWGFYMKDDKLGVKKVEDKVATNTYLTLGYSFKAFRFGLEYDIYEPPMIGFSPEWEGCKLMRGFAFPILSWNLISFGAPGSKATASSPSNEGI